MGLFEGRGEKSCNQIPRYLGYFPLETMRQQGCLTVSFKILSGLQALRPDGFLTIRRPPQVGTGGNWQNTTKDFWLCQTSLLIGSQIYKIECFGLADIAGRVRSFVIGRILYSVCVPLTVMTTCASPPLGSIRLQY